MTDVALWYLRFHQPDYELYESEAKAADFAAWQDYQGECTILGVQFPDGRTLARKDWPEFGRAVQRQREKRQAETALDKMEPPPAMREARDPFEDRPLQIEVSEPSWLGASTAGPARP
jgi:hypothetical protein